MLCLHIYIYIYNIYKLYEYKYINVNIFKMYTECVYLDMHNTYTQYTHIMYTNFYFGCN